MLLCFCLVEDDELAADVGAPTPAESEVGVLGRLTVDDPSGTTIPLDARASAPVEVVVIGVAVMAASPSSESGGEGGGDGFFRLKSMACLR